MTKSDKPLPKSTTPKAFDVFRPGKTQASPTSRPVIVGHKPTVQDSTVTDKPARIVGEPEYHHIMDSNDKVEVAAPIQEKTIDQKAEPEAATAVDKTDKQPMPQAANAADEISDISEELAKASSQEFYFQAEKTETAVEAGEVAVNHDAVVAFHETGKKKGLKIFVIAAVIVIVCVVAADVLMDTGVIKPTSGIPHTHFFKQ